MARLRHKPACRASNVAALLQREVHQAAGITATPVGLQPWLCSCVLALVPWPCSWVAGCCRRCVLACSGWCHCLNATTVFPLAAKGVVLVGVLLQGLPSFTLPRVEWSDLAPLIGGALGISLVALADTISTSSSFADRQV